ncbi:MAG TPA: pyridoxamine 5'-phosphate oxidase family protein [Nitrospira sp.]|nr:pyridoxamine 5'-phosphate oxidase family protein [Nitrospira sp.]
MAQKYLSTTLTESVCRAQQQYYDRSIAVREIPDRDSLGKAEAAFIAARDSFYLGSVSETGWPYIQHRGGAPGFLRLLDSHTLAFADYQGNRQLISTGNLLVNNRVALFLMDYRGRRRLKIVGHARIKNVQEVDTETLQHMGVPPRTQVERVIFVDVLGYDWNCPKHISPRYSTEDVEELVASLRGRISQLEDDLQSLRDRRLESTAS